MGKRVLGIGGILGKQGTVTVVAFSCGLSGQDPEGVERWRCVVACRLGLNRGFLSEMKKESLNLGIVSDLAQLSP